MRKWKCLSLLKRQRTARSLTSAVQYQDEDNHDNAVEVRQLTSNARTLIRAKRHADAEKIIDEGLSRLPWQSTLWFWKLVTKIGNSKGALEVWETMARLGIEKLPEHYDIMSNAILGTDAKHICIELFDETVKDDLMCNAKFYQTVLHACKDPRLLEDGKRIWKALQQNKYGHITLDPTLAPVFNPAPDPSDRIPVPAFAAVDAYNDIRTQLEPQYTHTDQIRPQERSETISSAHETLLASSTVSIPAFNYLIKTASRNHEQPEYLVRILEDSINRGLKPDANTYNPIIQRYFATGQSNEALDLIERMESSNVQFNMTTAQQVITGLFAVDKPDAAVQFFVDVFKGGSDITFAPGSDGELKCFNITIAGLCAADRLNDAQKLVQVMIERDITPNLTTYSSLVLACFQSDRVIDAMRYFDLATRTNDARGNMNWTVDLDTLIASVVRGFLIHERYEEAEQFISRCTANKTWQNTNSRPWCEFIRHLAVEHVDAAWTVFHHQVELVTDEFQRLKMYQSILYHVFLDKGDISGALDWFERLKEACVRRDQMMYVKIITSAMINGERKVAEQVYAEVKEQVTSTGEPMIRQLRAEVKRWDL